MILGIDLGTTYSVAAYVDESGVPNVITNMEGSQTTPSVVYFESESSVVVGQTAKDTSIINPEDVVSAVKNYMGEKKVFTSTHGQSYTPEVVSSLILKKLVSDAQKQLDMQEPIVDVVVTKPAYFTDAQITATEDAVKIAGLNLIGMINEPTAAALYYAVSTKLNHANVLVYDLGGGTFDVTIIRMKDADVKVLSTGGLSKVGGRFFDEALVSLVVDYIDEEHGICLEDEEYSDAYQDLFGRVEKAKIHLSSKEKAAFPLRVGNIRENVEITRAQFEEIVAKLYRRTEFVVKKALKDAGLTAADLDTVLLVGGSSRIPYIKNHLKDLLGKEPSHGVHPDLVVAQGAALYGNQLMAERNKTESENKVIHDVCSHSIGIVTMDRNTLQESNTILIRRNSSLPAEATQSFRTAGNNRQIKITVTEGEFAELSDVIILGSTFLQLPDQVEPGTQVQISLRLDRSQLVHVFVKVPSLRYEEEFTLERKANLSDEEIRKMTGIIADFSVD